MLKEIKTEQEFNDIIASEQKVLVDFFANWCGPCKMLSPILQELSEETSTVVAKVDIDILGDLASANGVSAVPTLILFQNGKVANKVVGLTSKSNLVAMVK